MKKTKEKGITLIALVVTIIVLLILAGVSITVLWGEHGILRTAKDATEKFGIEAVREKIENVKIDWILEKTIDSTLEIEPDFWNKLIKADIITNREDDVTQIGKEGNNTIYEIETNDGYAVEIIIGDDGKITIGDIEKGSLGPKIKSLKVVETTANSIKVKAEFLRVENATIKYYYKPSTDTNESSYIEIINVTNGEATAEGLTEGISYDIKVTVTMQGFDQIEKTVTDVIARDAILISNITLDRTSAMMGINTTLTLTATITPENADIKELIWSSSDETIATVDNNGKVTTKKEGLATITVKATDSSKKKATCKITVIRADGSFNETKGVNTPILGNGMTPIFWSETANEGQGDWVTPNTIDDWYDYSVEAKKWANAMTEDGSMWVWIPRYAYQISSMYHTSGETAGTINIKFLNGITDTAADGKNTWDNTSGEGNWNIHPGFEYDITKPGIWVAKFEASSKEGNTGNNNVITKTLQVKANKGTWRNISISRAYTVCINYNKELNSHLMKNTEWGACAYLGQSSYGSNSQITINTGASYITGPIVNGDHRVFLTTTGNIYGIYDMSGCSGDMVAAYVENNYTKKENNSHYSEDYGKALIDGEEYTKNVYNIGKTDTQENNYAAASKLYGDAIYETSLAYPDGKGWYRNSTRMPANNVPFFVRGGFYTHRDSAGAFACSFHDGHAIENYSFRPVLSI